MLDFPVSAEPELTPAERFRVAMDLYEFAECVLRQTFLREHPGASDVEVEGAVLAWLRERPGAELGDALGRPCNRPGLRP